MGGATCNLSLQEEGCELEASLGKIVRLQTNLAT